MIQHHANYKDGYFAVNWEKNRIDGPFDSLKEYPFKHVELRHFQMVDLKMSFFEKVCGASSQRIDYFATRLFALIQAMNDKVVKQFDNGVKCQEKLEQFLSSEN